MIGTLQKSANYEKATAQEWMTVAETRLGYLSVIDKALSAILTRASKIERVFDARVPKSDFPILPMGASGEETARSCRDKLLAMTHFTENLAQSALEVEATLRDVYRLATEATATVRPTIDVVTSTTAEDLLHTMTETTGHYDEHSPVTAGKMFEDDDGEYLYGDPREEEENPTLPGDAETPRPPTEEARGVADLLALVRV